MPYIYTYYQSSEFALNCFGGVLEFNGLMLLIELEYTLVILRTQTERQVMN